MVNQTLGTWQEDYHLREIEFEHILHGKPITLTVSISILLAEVGYFFNIAPKLIDHYFFNKPNMVTKAEWYTILIGIVIFLFFMS